MISAYECISLSSLSLHSCCIIQHESPNDMISLLPVISFNAFKLLPFFPNTKPANERSILYVALTDMLNICEEMFADTQDLYRYNKTNEWAQCYNLSIILFLCCVIKILCNVFAHYRFESLHL